MDWKDRIVATPDTLVGKPRIKGTRISVAALLEQLEEGESWEPILRGYPELTRADIRAALAYARQSILHTELTEFVPA